VDTTVASASVVITAPRSRVWEVLVRPETIFEIMPVRDVIAAWRPASAFVWRFEMQGKILDVTGTVLRYEADRVLEYDYLDPLVRNNRHRVTIELSEEGTATRVSVVQDRNLTRAALAHAEGGWRLALSNLKAIVEGRGRVP
jgi:uncharacterized protein YndB with AHSA1/START domain